MNKYGIFLTQDELDILNRYSSYQTISREGKFVMLVKKGIRVDQNGGKWPYENRKYILCGKLFTSLVKFKEYSVKRLLDNET
ncbi:MAG: hypothetical protein RR598_10200 [Anaerorhabdus sp.]